MRLIPVLATNDDNLPAPDKIPQADQPHLSQGQWETTVCVTVGYLVQPQFGFEGTSR